MNFIVPLKRLSGHSIRLFSDEANPTHSKSPIFLWLDFFPLTRYRHSAISLVAIPLAQVPWPIREMLPSVSMLVSRYFGFENSERSLISLICVKIEDTYGRRTSPT